MNRPVDVFKRLCKQQTYTDSDLIDWLETDTEVNLKAVLWTVNHTDKTLREAMISNLEADLRNYQEETE